MSAVRYYETSRLANYLCQKTTRDTLGCSLSLRNYLPPWNWMSANGTSGTREAALLDYTTSTASLKHLRYHRKGIHMTRQVAPHICALPMCSNLYRGFQHATASVQRQLCSMRQLFAFCSMRQLQRQSTNAICASIILADTDASAYCLINLPVHDFHHLQRHLVRCHLPVRLLIPQLGNE